MTAFHWFSLFLILSTTIFVNAGRSKRSPIVTDELTRPGEFPWAVAIVDSTAQYVGSGGIIGDKYILSAAHCFINPRTYELKTEKYTVYAGTTNYIEATSENGNHAVKVPVEEVFLDNDYEYARARADIAILKLQSGLNIKRNHLGKLNLPVRNVAIGEHATVAAFGASQCLRRGSGSNDRYGVMDGKLRHATMEIVQKDLYQAEVQRHVPTIRLEKFHLLGLMKKESDQIYGMCFGDSGSSLVDNSATVIGVLINVFDEYCNGTTTPSLFTNVMEYVPSIQRVMKGKNAEGMPGHKCNISITGQKGKITKLMSCLPCLNPKAE